MMQQYDFLNDSFTVFENVETPKITKLELPLGNIDVGDWGYISDNGSILANDNLEGTTPHIVNDNNPEQETSVTSQSFNTNRTKQAVDFFKSKLKSINFSDEQSDRGARAIVGNFMCESGDPTLNKTSSIGDKNLGPKGSAYGMGQWRLDRRDALIKFASKRGKPISDFNTQLEFAWEEMVNSQKSFKILEGLANSKTIEEATESFMNTFERPNKDPKVNAISKRIKFAKSLS